jgi:pyruvate,water dikinase
MSVVAFTEKRCTDVGCAGGKGASLARMAELGLAVPPGFAVSAEELAATLPDGGAELRALLSGATDETLPAVAEEAQRIVRAVEPSREAVAAAYRGLGDGDPAVAVRSSACAEDSEAASFAGQQETYLHVRGVERVIERLRDCWASFFSERALFYRSRKGSLDDLAMAVVVQRMVEADVSGVLFTCDPVRGRHDTMVVEAVFGLGEAVVSGQVTPDHYVLRRDGTVKRAQLSVQPYAVVADPAGGTRDRQLGEDEGGARTLGDDVLRELARIGDDLERRLGVPQDIEWALEHDRLFVLQARPVTA